MNHFKAYSIGYNLKGFLKVWIGDSQYEKSYKQGYYDAQRG